MDNYNNKTEYQTPQQLRRKLPFLILSIDGGGVRGLIPAVVLAHIEKEIGKRIHEIFDLVAGTSTGGILALGLLKPSSTDPLKSEFSAQDMVKFYQQESPFIFCQTFMEKIWSIWGYRQSKYSDMGLNNVLGKFIGPNGLMLSKTLKDCLITTYDLQDAQPYFFKSRAARTNPEKHDFAVADVIRATTAAPTYFNPHPVYSPDGKIQHIFIDGGVFANNPALCAFAEAKKYYSKYIQNNTCDTSAKSEVKEEAYSKPTPTNHGLQGSSKKTVCPGSTSNSSNNNNVNVEDDEGHINDVHKNALKSDTGISCDNTPEAQTNSNEDRHLTIVQSNTKIFNINQDKATKELTCTGTEETDYVFIDSEQPELHEFARTVPVNLEDIITRNNDDEGFEKIEEHKRLSAEEIIVVSLGTGSVNEQFMGNKLPSWGAIQWVRPLIDVMMDGASQTIDYQLRQLVPRSNYFRLDVEIEPQHSFLDDTSAMTMDYLNKCGQKITQSKRCAELVDLLKGLFVATND